MQALIHPLTELADYEEIEKKKQKEPGNDPDPWGV